MDSTSEKHPTLTKTSTTVSSQTELGLSSIMTDFTKKREAEHIEFSSNTVEQANYSNVENEVIAKFLGMSEDAQQSDNQDKEMSLLQGIKQYPKAAFWSVVLSSALIMEGYDIALLASLYALPAFAKKFGSFNAASGIYEISAAWQTGLSMCVFVGEIIGLQFAGVAADRVGYRLTLITALLALFCFIFVLFFAPSCAVLAVGEILCGIPWGCFQTLTVSYATEVCPLVLRYYLTTYVNVCWVIGQIMASGVLKNSQENLADSALAYKLPFALQWIWPLPIALGIYFAPESPWWLVKKNRLKEAERSLKRLITGIEATEKDIIVDAMIRKMKLTTEKEDMMTKNVTYWDCFKGVDGRRTRIASLVWIAQNACGSTLMGYSTYFYQKAGLSDSFAFNFSIIQYCLGFIGTFSSWFFSKRYGRFTIFTTGLGIQTLLLFVIGGLGFSDSKNASWAIGSLLLVFVFVYDIGVGPVTYCIVPEVPSTKLRTKTVIVARNFYNIMGIINSIWTPYMLNSTEWNWGAKTGLFWGGISLVMLVWAVLDLPETAGRTFGEIDELFAQKIPARKFSSTEVDPYNSSKLMSEMNDQQIENLIKDDERRKEADVEHLEIIPEDSD